MSSSLKYAFSKKDNTTADILFVNDGIVMKDSGTGEYYLIVRACDKAGNCSDLVSNIFKLDNKAPVISFDYDNSKWTKSASSKISVTDSNSGIDNDSLKYIFSLNSN